MQARTERPSGAKKKTKKKKTTPTVMAVPGINNIQEPIVGTASYCIVFLSVRVGFT